MRIVAATDLPMHTITQFGSNRATIGGLTRGDSAFQLGMLRLEPAGILGAHPATSPQLLVVISGEGWVSSSDSIKHPIQRGSAVYWSAGEMHETTADTELTAVIFEADDFTTLVPTNNVQSDPQ